MKQRLSKALAELGVATRREAERMVLEGRVMVNGRVVREPAHPVVVEQDVFKVDGKVVRPIEPIYLLVNKPRGVLSVPSDPLGRPTVMEKLRRVKRLLVPVARLEADDEGIMLMTSDRRLAHALNHPRAGIPRTYLMKVRGIPDDRTLAKLRVGVPLQGGRTLPMEVTLVSVTGRNAWLRVTVREVRHRLLRYAMMKLRHPVTKLKRVQFGPISVKGLAPGTFRKVSSDELHALKALADAPPGLPDPVPEAQIAAILNEHRDVGKRPRKKKPTRRDRNTRSPRSRTPRRHVRR